MIDDKTEIDEPLLDQMPSGIVEILVGTDGRRREYVRRVDHDLIMAKILNVIPHGELH